MRIQKKIQGQTRIKISGAVHKQVQKRLQDTCDKFDCSKALVITVALCYFFGLKGENL